MDPAIVSFRQFPNYGQLPENVESRQQSQPLTDNYLQYPQLGGTSSMKNKIKAYMILFIIYLAYLTDFGIDPSQYGLNGIRSLQTQVDSSPIKIFNVWYYNVIFSDHK